MARAQGMNGSSGNDEIGTPYELFHWLDRRFAFTFDAASSHENAKTQHHATVDGCYLNKVERYTAKTGLEVEWANLRVFVNPPYSRPLFRQFIDKAIAERNNANIIVMLAKYDPSTENGRLLREHFHLEYVPRIKYDGQEQGATFSSVIAIARPDYMGRNPK